LDQQSAQKELEERRREEMLLEKLCRQSKEERKLAEMLWECQLHKDVMRENRFFRDKQEQAQAARDKELRLEAEKAMRAKAYEEYQRQVENTVKRRDEFEATLSQQKTAKHEAVALDVIDSILQVVARYVLHKEKTDGLEPEEEYVEWCATIAAGQPVWPPPEPEPDAEELARLEQEAADIRDPVRVADAKRLDAMEWDRYLSWTGAWGCAGGSPVGQSKSRPPEGGPNNPFLCTAVSELQLAIAPVVPEQAPPVMPRFPIRACVLGKPYSGKSEICKQMEKELGCRRLSPDDIVSSAIDAFRAIIFDADNERVIAQDVQLQLGKRAFEQLSEGLGVDDETVVALLVHAIQSLDTEEGSPDAKPATGWVLDGFPSTLQQAKLFEQSTSGFVEPTAASSSFSSRLAASVDGASAAEPVKKANTIESAIGMVLRLDIEDRAVEERAHGHMVDINDNLQRYHLSSDPPELGENKFLNLVPEENESSADLHIGPRLRCYKENEFQLMQFYDAFGIVTVVDGSPPLQDVSGGVQQKLSDLEYEFNDVKDREFRTRPPTDLTGWGEDIEGPSSDQPLSEDERSTLRTQQMSELLMTQWMSVEQEVTVKSKSVFAAIRGIRQNAVTHYAKLKEAFAEYLHRPDERALEAMRFQDGFNSIEEWMRSDIEVKQELHLRADELQEKLWGISDSAREASDSERYALLGDGWMQDKCAECTFQLTKLMQMELMRYQGACMVLQTRDKFIKTGEMPPAMDLLQVGFELVGAPDCALVAPADGQAPREPEPEGGGPAAVVPSKEQLVFSLKQMLNNCLDKVTSAEDLEALESCKDELTAEANVCQHRLESIAARGEELIGGLCTRANDLGQTMLEWLDDRYKKEVSSTTGLITLVREAVEAEEMLMHDLKLDGTDFVIDEGMRVVPYKSEIVAATTETQPLPDRFTLRQLASIHEHLVRCAPSGFIRTEDFTWLLRRVANEGCIPSEWLHEDEDELVAGIRKVLERVDPEHTGGVNWREFLLAAALPQYPTDIELFDMRRNFDAADADSDGRVTMDEYATVKLWFDSSDLMPDEQKQRLRALIWPLFAVPDPAAPDDDGLRLFDYLAMLLYVSASSTVDAGVRRAFRTMANGDAPMKREEIARIVTGGIGALDDLQVEALGLVFNGKSDAARIQLEPILANPHGKAMMLGQKIYLKKDLYK
jgi:adenylate kinase family enzyme